MKSPDPVAIIEAAYEVRSSKGEWLDGVAVSIDRLMGIGAGCAASLYDASAPDWIADEGIALRGSITGEFWMDLFNQTTTLEEGKAFVAMYRSIGFLMLRSGPLPGTFIERFGRVLDRHGMEDIAILNAIDPTFRGCAMLTVARSRTPSDRTLRLWRRMAAHVAAGARLRRTLAALNAGSAEPIDGAEAVLTPSGRVEHAVGLAKQRSSRERLRESLDRIDFARSRRIDPDRAVAVWEALVAGRWSIVEHVEKDGKRYYLAHRNDPTLAEDRALTERERQVLGYAELGHSNKLIAYSLGLALSTVSTALTRARRKLGLPDDDA